MLTFNTHCTVDYAAHADTVCDRPLSRLPKKNHKNVLGKEKIQKKKERNQDGREEYFPRIVSTRGSTKSLRCFFFSKED